MPLYLSEAQVAELVTPADAIEAVEGSLRRLAAGGVQNPPRVRLDAGGGDFAVMACVDRDLGYAGLKAYAWLAPRGTPFLVVLFSLEHARIEAVVEADALGQLRTAAASAVAARHLARDGATSLGVIGCGRQGASHVAALRAALRVERVVAFCRDESRLAAFCETHDCVRASSARDAAEQDVVVTATTSRDPVVRGEWLGEGALVLAVGANDPSLRELDDAVLERAAFVCTDLRAQAQLESGDLIDSVAHGVLDWLEVHELQDVVTGEVQGRASGDDVVVFKSNGLAAWDLAVGALAVERAR